MTMGSADDSLESVRTLFKNHAGNKDGTMSKSNLGAVMIALDPTWSVERLDALFKAMDKDGNDKVDIDEFINWLAGPDDGEAPDADPDLLVGTWKDFTIAKDDDGQLVNNFLTARYPKHVAGILLPMKGGWFQGEV